MLRSALVLSMLLWSATGWARGLPLDDFIAKGRQVIAITQAKGVIEAEREFRDPKNGFVELDGPGLHVWATDAQGKILFDLSGQTTPGTDLSQWANDDGVVLMDMIAHRIDSPAGTLITRFKGVPHPRTNQMMDVDFWCGRGPQQEIVCATFWPDAQ